MEWRVGNGRQIRIWEDRWLPGSSSGTPKYIRPGSDCYFWVYELLNEAGTGWDEQLLNTLFSEEDGFLIHAIVISPRRPNDIPRWRLSADGEYIVRSGYRADFSVWWSENQTEVGSGDDNELWKQCWKLICPPRILTLVWRVLDDNLPVRVNLIKWGMNVEDICPRCGGGPETLVHLLFQCPWAKDIWRQVGVDLDYNSIHCAADGVKMLLLADDPSERSRRATCMWILWKLRNQLVFQPEVEENLQHVLTDGFRLWSEYLEQHNSKKGRSEAVRTSRWLPPEDGWLKVNVDAGLKPEGGGQVGIVVRDDGGRFIMAAARSFPRLHHSTILEGQAVRVGLEFAEALGLERIIVESDCLPVVAQLSSSSSNRSDLAVILDDCKCLFSKFQQVRICCEEKQIVQHMKFQR